MFNLSDKFHEQFTHIQQQFNEWKPFEQLCATIELTRSLQPSYSYFLSQFFQNQIQSENNDIFHHTVDEANTPSKINTSDSHVV
jgi:hypothetical protein